VSATIWSISVTVPKSPAVKRLRTGPAAQPPSRQNRRVDEAVQEYIEAIAPGHRALFDRLHRLILEAHPDATVALSYGIPTYQVGRRRLFVGAWKHGLSVYGWQADRDAGLSARYPELLASKSTIRLRPQDAADVGDDELREFFRATLDPGD